MSGFDDPAKLLNEIDENEKKTISMIEHIQTEFTERTNKFRNNT